MYMLKLFLGYHVEMIYSVGKKKKKMRDMLLLISILLCEEWFVLEW